MYCWKVLIVVEFFVVEWCWVCVFGYLEEMVYELIVGVDDFCDGEDDVEIFIV